MAKYKMQGSRLKEIRKALGLTGLPFASGLGISKGYLSEIETGRKIPSTELLEKLLNVYNININYLFTGEGNPFFAPETLITLPPPKDKEYELMKDIVWHINNIELARHALFTFMGSYLFDNRELMELEAKKVRQQQIKDKNNK